METKQRHGCLTAWLIFMIVANSLTAVVYLFAGEMITKNLSVPIPNSMMVLLALVGVANVIFSVFIFLWKKWAFWGFAVTSLAALIINITLGLGVGQSLFGLAGVAIFYGVLQIKRDNVTGWSNLG